MAYNLPLFTQENEFKMHTIDPAVSYAQSNYKRFLKNLVSLISIPSISTSPAHEQDMVRAAKWLQSYLLEIGMSHAEIFETKGHPVVFAEKNCGRPDRPTVLIYGHYDVQPPEPMDLWHTPPFEAQQDGDLLIARGASDMKGQVIASISAVESMIAQDALPVNIKFVLEGEEEIGSPNFPAFIRDHADLLKCDVVLNPDAGMVSPEIPTIIYALRGLSYFELIIRGPSHDLHSGVFGGVIHNPAIVLAEAIAGMHDAQGRIMLPGFYDRVIPLSSDEKEKLAQLPITAEYYRSQTGVPELFGEAGYTEIERIGARPTLDVNGMISGFTGAGSKTIIPSYAMAKLSMRLVPDQDPEEVQRQLHKYLSNKLPATITWELKYLGGGSPSISDINHPAIHALSAAFESVWGVKPVYKREGGSVPITSDFQKILQVESVLTGFGLPSDLIHSPNEHLHLPTWEKGIIGLIRFFYNYSEAH